VALLPGSSGEDAEPIAEHLRGGVASARVHAGPGGQPITVSIGVADTAQAGYALDVVVDMADRAMCRAKRAGRNRLPWHGAPTRSASPPRIGPRSRPAEPGAPD
jgi:PleD family two-component response regulator